MSSCPACGTVVDDAARFCPACGLSLAIPARPGPMPPAAGMGVEGQGLAASAADLGALGWLTRRSLPFTVVTATFAAALGYLRAAHLGFLAGLQGMAAGMFLGYVCARLGAHPIAAWRFGRRIRFALWSSFVFAVVQVMIVSVLHANPGDSSLEWLGDVLDGITAEPFFSMGKTGAMVKTAAGQLDGGGWLFFQGLDCFLFAFCHLAGTAIGLSGDEADADA